MRLTNYTDYSLRVLIYLAINNSQRVTISDIVEHFHIPRNHLIKIVNRLSREGFVQTIRGKGGGLLLARDKDNIKIGDVVRKMEPSLKIVDCQKPVCPLLADCRLQHILEDAKSAFLETLDNYTIADLVEQPQHIINLLKIAH